MTDDERAAPVIRFVLPLTLLDALSLGALRDPVTHARVAGYLDAHNEAAGNWKLTILDAELVRIEDIEL